MHELKVREERLEDREAIYHLIEAAFGSKDEAVLIEALRKADDIIFSLVAELNDDIVGHVVYSPVTVEHNPKALKVLGLGPIAVLPDYQKQGVGSSLIKTSLERCIANNVAAVVLLGHIAYYPKFGFEPASNYSLSFRGLDLGAAFMIKGLEKGALAKLSGAVYYVAAFD